MPRNKDLKRLVRARMKKTGEAYTAARAQITRKSPAKVVAPADVSSATATESVPTPKPKEFATLAGLPDERNSVGAAGTRPGKRRNG